MQSAGDGDGPRSGARVLNNSSSSSSASSSTAADYDQNSAITLLEEGLEDKKDKRLPSHANANTLANSSILSESIYNNTSEKKEGEDRRQERCCYKLLAPRFTPFPLNFIEILNMRPSFNCPPT